MLIARLPVATAFREAYLDDPAVANELAQQPEPATRQHPQLSRFTEQIGLLTVIADRLDELLTALSQITGGKGKHTPMLRPITEIDRIRQRAANVRFDDLVADVEAAQRRWAESHDDPTSPASQQTPPADGGET